MPNPNRIFVHGHFHPIIYWPVLNHDTQCNGDAYDLGPELPVRCHTNRFILLLLILIINVFIFYVHQTNERRKKNKYRGDDDCPVRFIYLYILWWIDEEHVNKKRVFELEFLLCALVLYKYDTILCDDLFYYVLLCFTCIFSYRESTDEMRVWTHACVGVRTHIYSNNLHNILVYIWVRTP